MTLVGLILTLGFFCEKVSNFFQNWTESKESGESLRKDSPSLSVSRDDVIYNKKCYSKY